MLEKRKINLMRLKRSTLADPKDLHRELAVKLLEAQLITVEIAPAPSSVKRPNVQEMRT